MGQIPFIDLHEQYLSYKVPIDKAISSVLASAQFIGGSEVEALELELSAFLNQGSQNNFCITCASGTDALILALKALELRLGDEVLLPSFSFIATASAVSNLGLNPIFVDIGPDLNIDLEDASKRLSPRSKALIAVSLFGQMPDFDALRSFCQENELFLIEDAAQSFGASDDKGLKSCTLADISITSFFPSKPLGCFGDGGAVFTQNELWAQKIKMLANHGAKKRYEHELLGFNSRLDALQAAILRVKLERFSDELAQRQDKARLYLNGLKGCEYPLLKPGYISSWAQFCVLVENREQLVEKLENEGIPSAIHYPKALHQQQCYKNYQAAKVSLKASEKACLSILSLPFSAFLSKSQQEKIIEVFNA